LECRGIITKILPKIEVIKIERAAHGAHLLNLSDFDLLKFKFARKKKLRLSVDGLENILYLNKITKYFDEF
jgi:hypothetical protein